jgi:hypothetical protein
MSTVTPAGRIGPSTDRPTNVEEESRSSCLIRADLEADPILYLRLEWHPKLQKLDNDI